MQTPPKYLATGRQPSFSFGLVVVNLNTILFFLKSILLAGRVGILFSEDPENMRTSQGGHGSWKQKQQKIKVNARILFILARNMINDPMNRRVIMPLMIHNHHQYFFGRYFSEL